jgi:hypothetical protein
MHAALLVWLRRVVIKKLGFSGIVAILIFLLAACGIYAPLETEDLPDLDYYYDGNSFTVYLDGSAPVRQDRALNHELALMGHDFFEVVFLYRESATNNVIARASWERGQAAGISGVYRDVAGGVEYSLKNIAANGDATAVLFVGNKQDKTLLAIGKLAIIDEDGDLYSDVNYSVPVTPFPRLYQYSRSVTFAVSTIRASAAISVRTAAGGSPPYQTVTPGFTQMEQIALGAHRFPLYKIIPNTATFEMEYWFENINSYITANTIVKAQAGAFDIDTSWRDPYYMPNTGLRINLMGLTSMAGRQVDRNTLVTGLNNNGAAGTSFQNPVRFNFNTAVKGGTPATPLDRVFAFVFSVPVCALSEDPATNPVRWYIRPGYGEYIESLDTGSGTGGAVFVGTIEATEQPPQAYRLAVVNRPQFTYSTSPWTAGKNFNLDSLTLRFYGSGTAGTVDETWSAADTPEAWGWFNFYIQSGMGGAYDETPVDPPFDFYSLSSSALDGDLVIRVEFDPRGKSGIGDSTFADYTALIPFTDTFTIRFAPTSSSFNFIYRYVGDGNEFVQALNALQNLPAGTSLVVVLTNDRIDINAGAAINITTAVSMVIVPGVPNVILGRQGGNGVVNVNGSGSLTINFNWEFADQLYLNVPISAYSLTLNAGGSAVTGNGRTSYWATPYPPYPTNMFAGNVTFVIGAAAGSAGAFEIINGNNSQHPNYP